MSTRQVYNLFQDLWNNPFWASEQLKRVKKSVHEVNSLKIRRTGLPLNTCNSKCFQTGKQDWRRFAPLNTVLPVKGEFLGKSRGPKFFKVFCHFARQRGIPR